MLPFQQQHSQEQNPPNNNLSQFNALGFNGINFNNPGAFPGVGINDFNLDQGIGLPLSQGNPVSMMPSQVNAIATSQPPQQQQLFNPNIAASQQPGVAYSPQNLMLQNNGAINAAVLQAQFQQSRAMYQANANSPTNPQQLLYQQQQAAAAAMAMNRVKQSPSSSPVTAQHPNIGSPMAANSPQQSRIGSNAASPVQAFQQASNINPSPQMNRVIPSQPTNMYQNPYNMQQIQQQVSSPQQDNISPFHTNNGPNNRVNGNKQFSPYQGMQDVRLPMHMQQQQQQQQEQLARKLSSTGSQINSASSTPLQQHRQISNEKMDNRTPPVDESTQSNQQSNRSPMVDVNTQSPVDVSNNNNNNNKAQSQSRERSMSASNSIDIASANREKSQPPLSAGPKPNPIQAPITYVPKTRNVETYGGVDLKYFDKFEIKPMVAHLSELGAIDIHALIMSLKSGLKMEVANALNSLTMLTVQTPLELQHCDDLLDVLLDILDQDFFGYKNRKTMEMNDINLTHKKIDGAELASRRASLPDQLQVNYADLFDMSLDEMKSLIPMLEDSTSEIWLSLRERCLCILNLLRNFSFISENVEYLAKHKRFVDTLLQLLNYTRGIKEEDWDDTHREEAWFVGVRRMDTLDHRKSVLMIFSNIGVNLKLHQVSMARAFVRLIHDFLTHGPDTYYSLLAIETWAKIAVGYDNQKAFKQLIHSNPEAEFGWIEDIWVELTTVVRKDFFFSDGRVLGNITMGQLATLEMVMMGLYNIIIIVNEMALKDRLIVSDKGAPMTILRLCITLAESGNRHFTVVTRRGMELIRGLLCGGDGVRRKNKDYNSNHNQRIQHNVSNDSAYTLSPLIYKVLDINIVREKLMMAMLKPSTDIEVLTDLTELLDIIESNFN
ncbi:unnamed protein product [Cunninghamella blakesleeana]